MKNKILITLIALLLIGNACKKNIVVINCEIADKDIHQIEYAVPINGVLNGLMTDSVKPDESGKFTISVPLEKAGFISLNPLYKSNPIYRSPEVIIAEPGKTYSVRFGTADNPKLTTIKGPHEVAQNEFNNPGVDPLFLISSKIYRPFIKDSVPSSIHNNIIKLRDKDIVRFKEMNEKGELSNDLFKLILADKNCYYALIEATIYQTKYTSTRDEMKQFWEDTYKSVSFKPEEIALSPWHSEYYRSFINYKLYMNNELNSQQLKDLREKKLMKSFFINNGAKKYLPTELMESFFANFIYYDCFLVRELEDYEIITLFRQFESEYPGSKYIRYLSPWVNKYIDYQDKLTKNITNEKIKYLDNYQNFNTFKDCISQFKGKKLYIDVWATWCGSCRVEFSKHEKLREYLKSNDIEFLYISMDEDKSDKLWKDLINFYNLEGFHVRVNKNLSADLIKLQNYNGGKGYYVPWHIMVDENGKMVGLPAEVAELVKE
jgi:thiol-disulfide isomerase/thioredoxin